MGRPLNKDCPAFSSPGGLHATGLGTTILGSNQEALITSSNAHHTLKGRECAKKHIHDIEQASTASARLVLISALPQH